MRYRPPPEESATALPLGTGASRDRYVMRPSDFDLVSSFLLAAMVMLASLVLILLTIWVLSGNAPELSGRVPLAMSMSVSSAASAGPQEDLTFLASSQQVYARQLDFHGIEIGAFGGGFSGIDYASQLATRPTARHTEDASLEQRLYFSWVRPSPLASHERQLLRRAGIATGGRQILKFVPRELEIRLAQIELEYAQTHGVSSPEAIAKTVFRSEGDGAEYRFVVVSQRYKRGPSSVVIGASNN